MPAPYRAYGGAAEMLASRDREVVFEGPAGTGKTRCALEKVYMLAQAHPGCRILGLRKTRASMTQSVLPLWEENVCTQADMRHFRRINRAHRDSYNFRNGSEFVIGGLDQVSRHMSAQYDFIVVFEATEISLEDFELLSSRLRNNKVGYHQIALDCNPGPDDHWINLRADTPKMRRILSRHADNPMLFDHQLDFDANGDPYWDGVTGNWSHAGTEYMTRLLLLTGARLDRLQKGLWVAEEGLVFDEWQPSIHVMPTPQGDWEKTLGIKWYVAAMDFGYRNPGTLLVGGVTDDGTVYIVAEVYRTRKGKEWWAEVLAQLHDEFEFAAVYCDPSEPDTIDMLNDRLAGTERRDKSRVCRKARNDLMSGLDLVREGLTGIHPKDIVDGRPLCGQARLFFLDDRLRFGRDEDRALRGLSCSFTQEVVRFVWYKNLEGRTNREEPDPGCDDHAIDALRYLLQGTWRRSYGERDNRDRFEVAPGTIAALFDGDWFDPTTGDTAA